jgi:hypothetical protein
MSAANRTLPTDVAMSSFGQSGTSTTQVANMMVGLKTKTVTDQGYYSANQSSAATTDVVGVWADYSTWDYTAGQALDVNSTNFRDPA